MTYRLYIAYVFLLFSSLSVMSMYQEEKEHDEIGWRLLAKYHEALIDRDDALDAFKQAADDCVNRKKARKEYDTLYGNTIQKCVQSMLHENTKEAYEYFNLYATGAAAEHRDALRAAIDRTDSRLSRNIKDNNKKRDMLIKKYNKWLKLYVDLDEKDQHVPLEDCLKTFYIINHVILKNSHSSLRLRKLSNIFVACDAIRHGGFDYYFDQKEIPKIIQKSKIIFPALEQIKMNRAELEDKNIQVHPRWDFKYFKKHAPYAIEFIDGKDEHIELDFLESIYDPTAAPSYSIDAKEVINRHNKKKKLDKKMNQRRPKGRSIGSSEVLNFIDFEYIALLFLD